MNLREMYGTLRNGMRLYDKMSDNAKNTWIFDRPMEQIEMIINNVEEYFMNSDKRFHQLATTVRSGNERYYEYESIPSVNTADYDLDSEYYTDSDNELPFSEGRKMKKPPVQPNYVRIDFSKLENLDYNSEDDDLLHPSDRTRLQK